MNFALDFIIFRPYLSTHSILWHLNWNKEKICEKTRVDSKNFSQKRNYEIWQKILLRVYKLYKNKI